MSQHGILHTGTKVAQKAIGSQARVDNSLSIHGSATVTTSAMSSQSSMALVLLGNAALHPLSRNFNRLAKLVCRYNKTELQGEGRTLVNGEGKKEAGIGSGLR